MLTIGIPTYNRVTGVTQHVRGLITESVHDLVQVLVIDNASTDGTFERLKEVCNGTPIRVLRNSHNFGYRGNFLRLFEECETEYLLVTSDEDPVIASNLGALLKFLQAHRPLLVSTQYSRDKPVRLFRGRRKTRPISPRDFLRCSADMPGLVFRTMESNEVICDIEPYLEKEELAMYPQVLLAAGLLLRGTCFWWSKPIANQKYDYPQTHGGFRDLPQRWSQHKAFVGFFEDRVQKATDPATKRMAISMLQFQRGLFICHLRTAIENERPDLLAPFDRGAQAFYVKHLLKTIAVTWLWLLRHPIDGCKALRRKIHR